MSLSLTRAQLLSRTAKGGAALLVGEAALGQYVGTAAAEPLPDGDLAYARLLSATELLGADFYARALASHKAGARLAKRLKLAHANEVAHYQSVGAILTGAGLTPAADGDIDFLYPRNTFRSE